MARKIKDASKPSHDEIAQHAYEIYDREGRIDGRDLEHWLRAEAELTMGLDSQPQPARTNQKAKSPAAGRAATPVKA